MRNFNFDRINPEIKSFKRKLNAKGKQSFWDISYYLKDDLLVKVDRASMKYSLKVECPYLDHRVIEYAINIDADLRYHNGISKYVLKKFYTIICQSNYLIDQNGVLLFRCHFG
jgi:asparagine synthase (glutamine-hydrolysing)